MMVSLVCVIFIYGMTDALVVAGVNQRGEGHVACHNPLRLREESRAMPIESA